MPRVSNSSPMMFFKMERSQSSFAVETFIQEFSWAVHTIKAKVYQIKDKHENHSFQENAVKINPQNISQHQLLPLSIIFFVYKEFNIVHLEYKYILFPIKTILTKDI